MIAEVQMTLTRPEVHVELTVDQQRWCADWLAQFFWAIDNDLEDLTNLYVPHRSTNPRTKGTYDPEDGKIDTAMKLLSPFMDQPDLWAYTCYIPPHEELEFPGGNSTDRRATSRSGTVRTLETLRRGWHLSNLVSPPDA
jgi:hypothetical protein